MFTLIKKFFYPKTELFFIDVGAYQGELSESLLTLFPQSKGILFEPTLASYQRLIDRFKDNPALQVFNCALSDRAGTSQFYLTPTPATNSLLNPKPQLDETAFQQTAVSVQTLDAVLGQMPEIEAVDFIKIDTQGNDLNVLQGATETIQKFSPALLVESLFMTLYQEQCLYNQIFDFMRSQQYSLAGIYNTHYTQAGTIAFSDLLFLPQSQLAPLHQSPEPFVCADPDYLKRQNQILQTACDERLNLIQQLTQIAEERMQVIEVLDSEVVRLRETIAQLQDSSNASE